MSFTFTMYYRPGRQKRYGVCGICHQGIEAGERVMLGSGYFHGYSIQNHNHYKCWLKEVVTRARLWFFTNEYKPKRMAPEKKAELNRLRARRYYIKHKGGELDEVMSKVAEIEKQIAFVKAG